jgi:uncharacterized protein (DUF2147 family)
VVKSIAVYLLRFQLERLGTRFIFLAGFLSCGALLHAQSSRMLGNWREPSGSVIRIEPCGTDLCMRIVLLSPSAPSRTDERNSDASLRSRSLCGVVIGTRFQAKGSSRASDGYLYDPKSGNTYRGGITLDADVLRLRGYIGLSLFGRTEVWKRNSAPFASCGQ